MNGLLSTVIIHCVDDAKLGRTGGEPASFCSAIFLFHVCMLDVSITD